MVAKLLVWDADREKAPRRMPRGLREFEIGGVKTLIPFHKAIMASSQWAKAETCRDLIEDKGWPKGLATPAPATAPGAAPRRRRGGRPGARPRVSPALASAGSPASASGSPCTAKRRRPTEPRRAP